jgi:tape measure domain-containing protein
LQPLSKKRVETPTSLAQLCKQFEGSVLLMTEQVEVIKLVSKLTDDYGGKIDKIAAAYGNFAAKGKVGIADINKFTAQGIPILDQLEKKYGKNRDEILALAKAGEITAQDLSDALVEIANRSDEVAKRTTSSFERTFDNLQKGAGTSVSAIAIILGNLVGVSTNVTGNIFEAFSSLYVNLVNGAVEAAARISDALASAANNIAAFYKANPLVIPALRDAAVSGLESFKAGAQGTSKQLRELTNQPTGISQIRGPQIPGQLPPSGGGGKSAADKAEKEAARIAEQIRASKLRLTLAQDIFAIEGRLQQAQLEGNKQLVLARNAQKELAQIASQRADIIANKEMPALAKKNVLNKLAIDAATVSGKLGFDLAKIEQDRTESFDVIIADLNLELELKTATTEQAREQLRLEAEIAKIRGDKSLTDPQKDEIERRKRELAHLKPKAKRSTRN